MASVLSEQLQCPVCLCVFTDPVSLPCDHTFCRPCISAHLLQSSVKSQSRCPECRGPFSQKDLRAHRVLTNMADAAREEEESGLAARGPESPQGHTVASELVCPEHDEKFKLFCETDQRLVCVICRDGEKHRGHTFTPVKEAAKISKNVLRGALGFLVKENREMEGLNHQQASEIIKTKEKSKSLSAHISSCFEELHQFLRRREEELKEEQEREEKKTVAAMLKNDCVIENRLMIGREMEVTLQSALEIPKSDHFLEWWSVRGHPVIEGMKMKDTAKPNYRSRVRGLSVTPDSLNLGLYETHLPFCMWKEMLKVVKPVPVRLTLSSSDNSYLKVSEGGASVRHADQGGFGFKYYRDYAATSTVVSTETVQTGQHYWEVEVGGKLDWGVGLKVKEDSSLESVLSPEREIMLHLKPEKGLVFSHDGVETPLMAAGGDPGTQAEAQAGPRRVGLYLDCDRERVSFYDADSMVLLHSSWCSFISPCSLCLCTGPYMEGRNTNPLTVCWY
ncbi:nuclear factor 7, brain-like [Salvelinus fontinalis]|uniref:nuclear factor 7, brain-like n=1 Tax=Salvelinus fontinalis TaxID=8038 RepID=UPI00248653B9|nr:nuclear factor 7, brain-like [Salvelinus fontinalis]